MAPLYLQILQWKLSLFWQSIVLSALFELRKGNGLDHIQELVLPGGGRLEKFHLKFLFYIVFTEVSRSDLHLVPGITTATGWPFDFRLVYRHKFSRCYVPVNNKEAQWWAFEALYHWIKDYHLTVCGCRHLFCLDYDIAWLFWDLWIHEWLVKHLITSCYDLMHWEYELPDVIMSI